MSRLRWTFGLGSIIVALLITVPQLGRAQGQFSGSQSLWTCSLNSIAATLTQCQAAPGAGLKLYLTNVWVQTTTTTSGTYSLQTGTGSNCGTGTAAFFPSSSTSNRFNAPITTSAMASLLMDPTPLVAPANSAICLIGVATNTISVQLAGYTKP